MTHTLVTILGRSRESKETGYRQAVYRFPDETEDKTAFFGLALSRHLKPDTIVILGTRSSQWSVLVEHLAADEGDEETRLQLMNAEANGTVAQDLLNQVAPLMRRAVNCQVVPRLIPFGHDIDEQYAILQAVADNVPPNGGVSFDLTHGFRHIGMVGFLSAFMLERIHKRNLRVRGLWYGALDMTHDGLTPVLKLDGLARVQRWLDALNRFDATGDYGVFAPLLIEDGMPKDKANCLADAAFFERTSNVRDAVRKIQTFLDFLQTKDEPLTGASGLFQSRLVSRLRWVEQSSMSERQRLLAHQYLERRDFVRAAIFGCEAVVSRICEERGVTTVEYSEERKEAVEQYEEELHEVGSERKRQHYWKLKHIRNALAHGTAPPTRSAKKAVHDPDRLKRSLQEALDALVPA